MRLTIKEAAERLDIPPQALRVWLQKENCPFGEVLHEQKSRHGRRTYYVNSERLERYLKGEKGNE